MLGWQVFVLRKSDSASPGSSSAICLASWETGLGGLRIDDLAARRKAVDLGGNGYPNRYATTADILFPILRTGLPSHHSTPVVGDDYALPAGYNGNLQLFDDRIANCANDEPLVIEAWDLS